MIFGLFGSGKKKRSFADLLTEFVQYQQAIGHIAKAQSLEKLGRREEANRLLANTERTITNYLNGHPREKQAHLLLAMFYTETGLTDRAETEIDRILKSRDFELTEEERLVLSGELQNIQRQRPIEQRLSSGATGFTKVYCCQNCGRLHNFVSMPCPHCDWFPRDIEEMARSIILSNPHFKIPALLLLSREMAKGRPASDVVPNLIQDGKTYLAGSEQKRVVEKVFLLLKENEHKNHRSIHSVRGCPNCGQRILMSTADKCEKCGSVVQWPDAIRALACMDNLLWLFEQRVEVSPSDHFAEFVSVLVAMTNNLLRKQESPQERTRLYALNLLEKIVVVSDLNKGAVIDTKDPLHLTIYLIKDSMRDDSERFGTFLFSELEHFVQKMVQGVQA